MTKRILLIAGLLSGIIAFADYMVYGPSPHLQWYPLSLLGTPGALVAQIILAVLRGGHGGGPIYQELMISAPVNFGFYAVLGWGISGAWRMMKRGLN